MSVNTLIGIGAITAQASLMLGRECRALIEPDTKAWTGQDVLYLSDGATTCDVVLDPAALTLTLREFTGRYLAPMVSVLTSPPY